jgi:DNA polymerase I
MDEQDITKTGWSMMPLLKKLESAEAYGIHPWTDLQLAAYLLDPDGKIDWALTRSKYKLPVFEVPVPYQHLEHLPAMITAYKELMRCINEMDLTRLLFDIELPLARVLARMEMHGIAIDPGALKQIENVLCKELSQLEQQLHDIAGKKLNFNSPSQIAEILKILAHPSELKKTPTGQVSTAEPFLADLAPKYPFVDALLRYRKLNKIITTYVQALPRFVNPNTKKIHPSFQQVVAGTGRLSCTEPNLQNLPIRNETGREVRRAVIPSGPGFSIVSIDYNQVELRLLAALSNDKVMVEAFRSGKDIHTITACKLFGVKEKEVTKDLRSKAKGVNFGIAYGITPWGLATRLKISQKEGKEIIDTYFGEFPAVREYLSRSIEDTRAQGYTRTLYGRIRYIDGINSRNGTTRKMAERMAVNAPLQGLASDIIKEAMVRVDAFIRKHNLKTRLVLQVHDELVFDACDEELDIFIPEAVRIMEAQSGLAVPMKVNVMKGPNWLELG